MAKRGRPRHPDVLTPREWEVLALLRENLTNEQIAERLGVTVHAARYHVSEILSKLGVATREEAAAWQPDREPVPSRRWSSATGLAIGLASVILLIGLGLLAFGVFRSAGDDALSDAIPTPTPPLFRVTPSPTVTLYPTPTPNPDPTPIPKPFVARERPLVGANVLDMQIIGADEGVVLTTDALLRAPIIDSATEKIVYGPPIEITPTSVPASEIGGVYFRDANMGWVTQVTRTLSGEGLIEHSTAAIWRTTDGGQTWQSFAIPGEQPEGLIYGDGYFDFLSAQKGWVVFKEQSNTAHSYGSLFTTEDGGATWTQLTIPTGSPVYFANASDGWSAGGPVFANLFATHDGGVTWSDVTDITPNARPAGTRIFGLPQLINGGGEILLPTLSIEEGEPPRFRLYESSDNGQSWNLVAQQEKISGQLGLGLPLAVEIFPDGSLVLAGDLAIFVLPVGSTTLNPIGAAETGDIIKPFSSTGFFSPAKIDFIDLQHGWALAYDGGCTKQAVDCWQASFIEQTDDGGRTWTVLKFGADPTRSPAPTPNG
ncbi:MAG: LuxR C-terminal-related transcriptional regulator [Chloroflexota bacterium]